MGTKAERRAARERVSAYHKAQLAVLSAPSITAEPMLACAGPA